MPHIAVAQSYPTRPVNLVVFVPAGATPDIVARFAAAGAWQVLLDHILAHAPSPKAAMNLNLANAASQPA
jgi:hypothetical protein